MPISAPKRPVTLREAELALLRVYAWLSAGLYPGWSLLIYFLLPDEVDAPYERLGLGLACLAAGLLSYSSEKVRQNFAWIIYGLFATIAVHFFYLVYLSQLSFVYVIGSIVVAMSYGSAFISPRPLALYSTLLLTLSIGVSILSKAPLSTGIMLVGGILTSQIVAIASSAFRFGAMRRLEKERVNSLLLKQKLLDQ